MILVRENSGFIRLCVCVFVCARVHGYICMCVYMQGPPKKCINTLTKEKYVV